VILVEALPERAMTNYCRVAGADASFPRICVLTVNSAMLPVLTAIRMLPPIRWKSFPAH
jgi:hypothetical protein